MIRAADSRVITNRKRGNWPAEEITMFYHEAIIRQNNRGRTVRTVWGSEAKTIDEAAHERAEIVTRYHPNEIIEITTKEAI
jgi:hypothetical protein